MPTAKPAEMPVSDTPHGWYAVLSGPGRRALAVAFVALVATGCSDVRQSLGLDKRAPDEFAVVPRAPLSVPPDFSLRPPDPGAPRPQELSPTQEAKRTIIGPSSDRKEVKRDPKLSSGENALLNQMGATNADPSIRGVVDKESKDLADGPVYLIDYILFWRKQPPPGTAVDATKEAQRIQQNQALGRPVTDGPTPSIERRSQGLFNSLF